MKKEPESSESPHGPLHLRHIFRCLYVAIDAAGIKKDIWLGSGLLSFAAIIAKGNGVSRALFVDFAGRLYDTTSELFDASDEEDP